MKGTMESPVKTKICSVVAGLRNLRLKACSAAKAEKSTSREVPSARISAFLRFEPKGMGYLPPCTDYRREAGAGESIEPVSWLVKRVLRWVASHAAARRRLRRRLAFHRRC